MTTEKERLASLETSITYIKDKVDHIDKKVNDLTAFKFKVAGAASVLAAGVSYIMSTITH